MIQFRIKSVFVGSFLIMACLLLAFITHETQTVGVWSILSLVFYASIPGYCILSFLKTNKSRYERFVYAAGLSVLYMTLSGYAANALLPLFNVHRPLDSVNLLPFITVTTIVLLLVWTLLKLRQAITINIPTPKVGSSLLAVVLFTLPIQAALGAIRLNNGASSVITVALLCEIVVLITVCVLIPKNNTLRKFYPIIILSISMSLLLSYSLRGNHITGWDINYEYRILQISKERGIWSASLIKDAYNSCLSITILPSALSSITNMGSEYIFKVLFPAIFSLTPMIVFLIARRYISSEKALLASVIFMAQPQFSIAFPMLARQEIAFLFVSLLFLIVFSRVAHSKSYTVLFVLFSLGLVVSHYSSSYIVATLFLLMYAIQKISHLNILQLPQKPFGISGLRILALLLICFLWLAQATPAGAGFGNFVGKAYAQIFLTERDRNTSESSQSALWGPPHTDPQKNLNDYYSNVIEKSRIDVASTKNILVPTTSVTTPKPHILIYAQQLSSAFLKVAMLVGVLLLVFHKKSKKTVPPIYVIACCVLLVTLAAFLLIPYLSISYNFERLSQMALAILALPMVIGALFMLKIIPVVARFAVPILTFIVITYFASTTGLIYAFRGSADTINLSNSGAVYDRFYLHDGEVSSMKWLENHADFAYPIFADRYGTLKFASYTSINAPINSNYLAALIGQPDYVYMSYTNKSKSICQVYASVVAKELTYICPDLSTRKNVIYANNVSAILK